MAVVLAFLAAFIYFYPLTLRISYQHQCLSLAWLPRLCGGYARPHPLGGKGRKGGKRRFKLPWRRLLRHTHLNKLDFLFFFGCGSLNGQAECIIHARCGDIIRDIAYAWWQRKKKEARYGRRA